MMMICEKKDNSLMFKNYFFPFFPHPVCSIFIYEFQDLKMLIRGINLDLFSQSCCRTYGPDL